MTILNATELYTLRGWILWYVNYITTNLLIKTKQNKQKIPQGPRLQWPLVPNCAFPEWEEHRMWTLGKMWGQRRRLWPTQAPACPHWEWPTSAARAQGAPPATFSPRASWPLWPLCPVPNGHYRPRPHVGPIHTDLSGQVRRGGGFATAVLTRRRPRAECVWKPWEDNHVLSNLQSAFPSVWEVLQGRAVQLSGLSRGYSEGNN